MIDKDKLIKDLEERQDKTMKEDTCSALGEFQAYANILKNIHIGKYDFVNGCVRRPVTIEPVWDVEEYYQDNDSVWGK